MKINGGAYQLVAGLLTALDNVQPYAEIISRAEQAIGIDYGGDARSAAQREQLVAAVKLNIINRRDNSYERLARMYTLPCGKNKFGREKRRFVAEVYRSMYELRR